jgi:hypothetical protein
LRNTVGNVEGVVRINTAAIIGDIAACVVLDSLAVNGEEFVAIGLVGGGDP